MSDRSWRRYLRFWRHDVDADIDDELRFHLDARVEELVAQGVGDADARARALDEFGSVTATHAGLRSIDTRVERRRQRIAWREELAQDLRFATRSLRRQPGFAAIAVLTLALGIGANSAIFSLVDGVLLKPLPYREPGQLVRVWPGNAPSKAIFAQFQRNTRSFEHLAGVSTPTQVSVTRPCPSTDAACAPARLVALEVTASLFDLLGARATIGRALAAGDDEPRRARVAVLSHALWRDAFAGDPRALGSSLTIDGTPHTIVGVMPKEFAFPSADVRLWTPATIDRDNFVDYWWSSHLRIIARLRPEIALARAGADVRAVATAARSTFPMRMPDSWGRDADVVPLQEHVVGHARPTLVLLLGAVGLVLLGACVNVANLLLGRATAREGEIAIRSALGARRGRVVRQLLVESAILGAGGAALGLAFAQLAIRGLIVLLPPDTPRISDITIDARVLVFTLILSIATSLAFGLMPALRASRPDLRTALIAGSRRGGGPRRRASELLVVAQIALAVLLVTGAGLLIKSFWLLSRVDPGFRADDVVVAEVPTPSFASDSVARGRDFYDAVTERARAIHRVHEAAVASTIPFGAVHGGAAINVEAHPNKPGAAPPFPEFNAVTPAYRRVLGIPLLAGRDFTSADRERAPLVALVDDRAARALWPGESALGQRLKFVWSKEWMTVVGVVGSIRRDSLSATTEPSLYVPLRQNPGGGGGYLLLRQEAGGSDDMVAAAIRSAVASVDASVPIGAVRRMNAIVGDSAARSRFTVTLLVAFAAAALLLGAIGIYGVVAYAVARRTREIGVRMALGARRTDVLAMVLRESGRLTALGLVIGLAGAVILGHLFAGLLYGVRPTDFPVLAVVPLVLGAASLIAALLPARRASRIDPVIAMRAE